MISHGEILRAMWAVDSETGEQVLVNLDTNKIIARRIDGKITEPAGTPEEPKSEPV